MNSNSKQTKTESPQAYKALDNSFRAPEAGILIVDDMPMNIQIVSALLEGTGMHIDTAESGEECLGSFGENDYDVVLIDYRMPDMDGIETLKKMHEDYPEKAERATIISLTASALEGDRDMMIEAGFDDYLVKPVNLDELETMLIKYLPADKVIMKDGGDKDGSSDRAGDTEYQNEDLAELSSEIKEKLKKLSEIPGLDVETGIKMCGSAEDFTDAAAIFGASAKDKAGAIKNESQNDDLTQYVLLVHSLKTMSKTIGAIELGDLAEHLENAGRKGDVGTVNSETGKLVQMYLELDQFLSFL